ncbi:MAG: FHA domain-containing protein [Xanthomonadales bacterium]|nr:FHA domain-containing protein [Xanthomonadales bacterium]
MRSVILTLAGAKGEPTTIRSAGEVRIGSAEDCDLRLTGTGIAPVHARVTLDDDGAMLRLQGDSTAVELNGRSVESLAFLHDGDLISIAEHRLEVGVQGDRQPPRGADEPDERATRVRRVAPRYVLRGVTGSQFGRLIPIYGRLVIGRGGDCDLVLDEPGLSRRHAVLETMPDGLFLRDMGSANGSFVNGARVRDVALRHGDQIVLDSIRFLVQAIDQMDQPTPPPGKGEATRGWGLLPWLLAGTALFAAGVLTALLLLR